MNLKIPQNQIVYKKVIGKTKGVPVLQVGTMGGLWLISKASGEGETLGVASHPAIARYIAKKIDQDIEYTELSKSEEIDPEHFAHLVPKYEELTEQFRNNKK